MPLPCICLTIQKQRRLRPSRRGGVGDGSRHRVVEAVPVAADGRRVGRRECPLTLEYSDVRPSIIMQKGFRAPQGPPLVITRRGVEFPGAEPDLRAVFHMSGAGLGRADALSTAPSLRGTIKSPSCELVGAGLRRREASRRDGRLYKAGVPPARGGLGV